MAATELATAYVSLVPSMRGASGSIAKELSGADWDGAGKAVGGRMGGGILGSFKGLIGPASALMAGIGIGKFVADSFDALQKIEVLNAQTANVIKSTGGAAGVSSQYITDLANSLEGLTATEAETIQQGANMLLTFTNIKDEAGAGNNVFTQATGLMVDYARALGTDTQGAALQLGKALNDPIKGVAALGRAGVQFTDQQKDQIKVMQESGDILGAQKVVLAELEKQFGGSGAAYAQTTAGKIDLLKNAYGDLGETLVSSFMPAVGDASTLGTTLLNSLQPVAQGAGEAASAFVKNIVDAGPRISTGMSGIKSIIVDGDFTGAFATAFGVEEDSPVVGALLTIREKVITVFDGIRDFIRGFRLGPELADSLDPGQISGMAEIGAVVRDVFNGIAQAVGPLIPHIVELWTSLSPLSLIFQAIQPFLPPLLEMFGQLASVIGGTLISAITGILPSIMSLQTIVVDLLQGTLAAVLPVVVQLVTMLGETFAQLMPVLIPIIATVVQLAATLISQLAPIFMELVTAVLPIVVSIMGAVLDSILPLVMMLAGLLIPVIQALMPVVVTVFSVVVDIIKAAMQIVQGIIQVVTGIISGNWSQVFEGLGNIVGGVFNFIVSIISGAIQIVSSVIGAGLNFVGSIFSSVFNGVVGFLGGVWSNITNGVSGMIGNVLNFFTSLPGKILGALGNLGSILFNAGKDIIQGLINGISGMMGAIGRAVLNIVPEAIRGPFEDLMGIRSPSRVAIYWGHMIGGGLISGIEDMYDPVQEATALLAGAPVIPAFATSGARAAYAGAANPADTARSGPLVEQHIHPREKMSEENLANISAGKIVGALT